MVYGSMAFFFHYRSQLSLGTAAVTKLNHEARRSNAAKDVGAQDDPVNRSAGEVGAAATGCDRRGQCVKLIAARFLIHGLLPHRTRHWVSRSSQIRNRMEKSHQRPQRRQRDILHRVLRRRRHTSCNSLGMHIVSTTAAVE